MHKQSKPTKLIYASGERDADIYYATGISTADPYAFLEQGKKRTMFTSALELSRAKSAATCKVGLMPAPKSESQGKTGALLLLLREKKIRKVEVPYNFPLGLAQRLKADGIAVSAAKSTPFFPERRIKSEREIGFIQKTQDAAQEAIALAIRMIKASKADDKDRLFLHGKPLTSEYLQERMSGFLSGRGFEPGPIIVSCGAETSMPHARGTGQLRNNRQVIMDVFPRSASTRYFGDVTRTVVKGEPSRRFERMYEAVHKVQLSCLDEVAEGRSGPELYAKAVDMFKGMGFEKKVTKHGVFGFNHGLGHGVGLEIHEEPGLSPTGGRLEAGNVVTVEPGLYYPQVGGVRIEDTVAVTKDGYKNLTWLAKDLQIL